MAAKNVPIFDPHPSSPFVVKIRDIPTSALKALISYAETACMVVRLSLTQVGAVAHKRDFAEALIVEKSKSSE
jgi:hypothetical protein